MLIYKCLYIADCCFNIVKIVNFLLKKMSNFTNCWVVVRAYVNFVRCILTKMQYQPSVKVVHQWCKSNSNTKGNILLYFFKDSFKLITAFTWDVLTSTQTTIIDWSHIIINEPFICGQNIGLSGYVKKRDIKLAINFSCKFLQALFNLRPRTSLKNEIWVWYWFV